MEIIQKRTRLLKIIAFIAVFAASVAIIITASYAVTNARAETPAADNEIAALAAENGGIKHIESGLTHTAILFNNGKLYTAGENTSGGLGQGDKVDRRRFTEVAGLTNVTMVACGDTFTMAISGGKLYGTGSNYYGQLGLGDNGANTYRISFTEVPGITDVTTVVCGQEYTMVISDGKLYGAGLNRSGQLGLGDMTFINRFTKVPGMTNVSTLAIGGFHTMAISDGKLYATGLNTAGQLGLGDTNNKTSFTEVTGLTNVTMVACGYNHTMAISGGKLYATGKNDSGQLGLGDTTNQISFTEVPGITDVTMVMNNACVSNSVFVISAGKLYATGKNDSGQLGLGDTTNRTSFTEVTGITDVTMVTVGKYHVMAISGGKLYGTGYDSRGQLGTGDRETTTSFKEVSLSNTIKFNANGGTKPMNDQVFACGAYPEALTANNFDRDGYKFVGWSTTANGEKEYDDKSGVVYAEQLGTEMTLYAVWSLNDPAVKIDASASEITYGSSIVLTANVTISQGFEYTYQWYKDGSEFAGNTEEILILTEVSDSGSYTVKVTAAYNGETASTTSAAKSVTIIRANIDLSVTLEGWTYGAKANEPVISGNAGNGSITYLYKGTANDGETYESANAPEKAGTYTLTVTVGDTANYLGNSASVEFTIARATVEVPTVSSKVYTGGVQTAGVTDNEYYTVTVNNGGTASKTYNVQLTLRDANNYSWADGAQVSGDNSEIVTLKFEITRTSNEWIVAPKVYGITYGGELAPIGETKFGEVVVAYETSYGKTLDGAPVDAGSYKAIFTVAATADYDGMSATIDFVIAPREIVVEIDDKTSEYGAEHAALTYNVTNGEILAGDELNVKLTKASGTNANTYAITGEWSNKNYNVTFENGIYEITKATYDMSGAKWEYTDAYTYDGTEKSVSVTGLPAGVTVGKYTNSAQTNAGSYTASVTFKYDAANYNAPELGDLRWTIEKAVYDMSGVEFANATITYNGETHSIAVKNLPAGVSVTYENNYKTNAGTYEVTAKFAGDTTNYEPIADKTATLTIKKAVYDMDGVEFENVTITYDGETHSIAVKGMPAGVTVTYENNYKTNAGTYEVTAKFAGDTTNYESIADKTATLTINKAVYNVSGITFENVTVNQNGQAHSIYANGVPAGVTVAYVGNGQTEAGTYTVTAKFTADGNHEAIADMTATLTINEAVEKGGCGSVVLDGVTIAGIALAVLAFAIVLVIRKAKNKK